MERTYVMLKPDAMEQRVVGEIITRIEKEGFKIENIKLMNLQEALLREHYAHITSKPFFPEIIEYFKRGPVIAMIVSGDNVIQRMRNMMGTTDPLEAEPGTIRRAYAKNKSENIIHGSDSEETASVEIARFFGE